jgi:Fur family iron response transcriptional regulator
MLLRSVGLRPTYQRIALWWLLFRKGNRHITPEMLHLEATQAKVSVSVATAYMLMVSTDLARRS